MLYNLITIFIVKTSLCEKLNEKEKEKMNSEIQFRYAVKHDASLILKFIKELAEYEKLQDEVIATEKLIEEWIFEKRKAEVVFAVKDGQEIEIFSGYLDFFDTDDIIIYDRENFNQLRSFLPKENCYMIEEY